MKFEVLYADNPWQFANEKTGGNHQSGASQKYPVMPLSAIMQLPVPAVSQPTSALFLWVPTRLKFSHGNPTAMAWGFHSYETTIYWRKIRTGRRLGLGFWLANEVEELLVYTRGDMAPWRARVPNVLSLPVLEHSEKPEEFRRLIEEVTGHFSRRRCLELFARKTVTGWTGIGKQVTGNDVRADLRTLAGITDPDVMDPMQRLSAHRGTTNGHERHEGAPGSERGLPHLRRGAVSVEAEAGGGAGAGVDPDL